MEIGDDALMGRFSPQWRKVTERNYWFGLKQSSFKYAEKCSMFVVREVLASCLVGLSSHLEVE